MSFSAPIVITDAPILLMGAGPTDKKVVKELFLKVEKVICADGGLNFAQKAGIDADLVVGDFDSTEPVSNMSQVKMADQNFTDFEKALSVIDAPIILGTGFLGGRLDHQLAVFSVLIKVSKPVVLVDDQNCVFIVPSNYTMIVDVPDGAPVAFFPVLDVCATIEGVKWPVWDAQMSPTGLISTSNHMAGDLLTISTDGLGLLAILPSNAVQAIIKSFQTLVPLPKPPGPPQ